MTGIAPIGWRAPPLTRTRFIGLYGVLGLGVGTGLLVTAVQVALRGWGMLALLLAFNLLWSPLMGFAIGRAICPIPPDPDRSQRFPRFRIHHLIVAVAVVGVIFGVGVEADRVSRAARQYQQKAINFPGIAKALRDGAALMTAQDAKLAQEAELLREHKIPETLTQGQKDFLRSLEDHPSSRYRDQRYQALADSATDRRRFLLPNVREILRKADHFESLGAKYDRAARRPWRRVAPDPPEPR